MRALARKIGRGFEGLLDAGWLLASPQRAQTRLHFRRMERDFEYREAILGLLRLRGYRAAKTSGSKTPWLGGGRSADAEILSDLPSLRNRSRELNRDDSIGSGLTRTFMDNVVGTGMRGQARTGDDETNTVLEGVFSARQRWLFPVDDLTFGAAQRLLYRKWFEDGEVFVYRIFSSTEPLWFEVIEADRVGTPQDKISDATIRNGIERDAAGRVRAYWVARQHPGDGLAIGSVPSAAQALGSNSEDFQRVLAEDILHIKTVDRPGQTRGVPRVHAILQDIRDLDLLMLASLKRTQIAACLGLFIKSTGAAPDIVPATAQKYGYEMDQAIEPGMMFKLYPDEEIETLVPNFPVPELVPFIIMLARRIGAAMGISWQLVLRDWSESTYSSARTDLLESRQTFRVEANEFAEKALRWLWESVMIDARLRNVAGVASLDSEALGAVDWIGNGHAWVDPTKEATGARIELAMGRTTLRELCAEDGKDWEEVLKQRLREEQRERDLRAELGLPTIEESQAARTPSNARRAA